MKKNTNTRKTGSPFSIARALLRGGLFASLLATTAAIAADMPDMWSDKAAVDSRLGRPDTRWFEDAKFGLFVHWGLYSAIGNEWHGKSYYGSGEWIMNCAKIPAAEYATVAQTFNPTGFDADEWVRFAKDAGMRYIVVTSKHHEGFAMFRSKASPFNIVDATPYGKDPMAALATACQREGMKLGFYYSQFLDWHEPNGGGNKWDFDEAHRDVARYYAEKSIPQIKELLTQYGPLGVMWFDMPGGLSQEETVAFMRQVRQLQPNCLISSRVGRGLGDFRDFGDSELPANFIEGPWEAIFTHNDSWGFVRSDANFKTPREIIQLLAATSARGGNLMLNVGPDGTGRMPADSVRFLREVGQWLTANGDSIYGTTHSPIPDQSWGVATRKPGRLFLHVFNAPRDRQLVVPGVPVAVTGAHLLGRPEALGNRKQGTDLIVTLPGTLPDPRDSVVVVEFTGDLPDAWTTPTPISSQFDAIGFEAARAAMTGKATLKSITHSEYFGNWKHDTCAVGMVAPDDRVTFAGRVLEPGDYRVTLEYASPPEVPAREGIVELGGRSLAFETLATSKFDSHQPLMRVHHAIGVVTLAAGPLPIVVRPKANGAELCWLRRVILEPVR